MHADDLTQRAIAAYFRTARGQELDQPSAGASGVVVHKRLRYVVLRGGRMGGITLAVYRVRQDGMLKRLKRWPKELDKG
jgi:hypothetical protein